jgi:CubicO group peptidase (beta-lactamase class C family)
VSELLPRALFSSEAEVSRFKTVTLRQVLGMAVLDAPDPPRVRDAAAWARYEKFWHAPNRVVVALQQPSLKEAFQYNDSTPTLASAAVQYATHKSALEFAEETLFGPMGFRNYEWMHQDASGFDNAGYGLRLRPIDMQKFGLLYLNDGEWKGRRLISRQWIERSFEPWNRSTPDRPQPDYGWFWWAKYYGPGFTAHVAIGWKGQRIAVFPEQQMVITMTGCVEDGSEGEFFDQLVTRIVIPSLQKGAAGSGASPGALGALLDETRRGPSRIFDFIEYRMVPSIGAKAKRRPFVDSRH